MYEHQSHQVDCGSADDGLLDEEAPDLGPLRETAEAAELAEATAGLTDGSGGPLPAEDPLRPLACAVARALTEAGFTLHHCARHHPRHRLGGVCLLPVTAGHAPESKAGVVVSWTTHDLPSLDWCRWPEYHGTQQVMNGAPGQVLGVLGFQVAPFGSGGAHIVTDGTTTVRLVSAPAQAPSVRVLRTLRKLATNAGSCSVAVVWRTSRSIDQ